MKGGVIENCLVNAEISATSSSSRLSVYAGGIAGRSAGGEIRKCTTYAETSAQNAAEAYAGRRRRLATAGEAEIDGIVESCSHYGSVSASSQLETAAAYAGGVVGYNAGVVRDSFDVSVLVKASWRPLSRVRGRRSRGQQRRKANPLFLGGRRFL